MVVPPAQIGVCLTAEENPGKPQPRNGLIKAMRRAFTSNEFPYLQMASVGSHSISGREKEGNKESIGRGNIL